MAEQSYMVQKALEYIIGELKAKPHLKVTSLFDEAGARYNLSPIEVDSLERIFKEEYNEL